ncbi:MAG TPA: transglutaminase domain-containing protein [Desulfuromonadaceae bacterium]|jgi:transglutaminase-like putative cysteine protease
MKRFAVVLGFAVLFVTGDAFAKTLMLEGSLNSSIAMRQQMEFHTDSGAVQSFTFRFALPADFQSKSVSQTVDSLSAKFDPQPSTSIVEQDRFGNRFQKVTWNDLTANIRVNLGYTANVRSELSAMESRTPFPIGKIPGSDALYLKTTEMVQADAVAIIELACRLTAGANNEYEAVTAITNHVADNIKYSFNPAKYDAVYTLETKSGNCQNFAHLDIALLRSVGIPARIVGGITLKDAWKVPIDARNSIVQSMGQGGHAWIEIYFPDLGWLPYDPQQSRQFTSSRHIKQTHGLDSRDINDTWRGAPYLPRYAEMIEGTFKTDEINLKVKNSEKDPRPYIISNLVAVRTASVSSDADINALKPSPKPSKETVVKPPAKPTDAAIKPSLKPNITAPKVDVSIAGGGPDEVRIKPPKMVIPPATQAKYKKPLAGSAVTFGNMDFPNLVNAYNVHGDTGTRILDKETSEYVSSQHIYAQAFYLKDAIALQKVSLAMRKFGGDGTVYVDLVRDEEGKPNILKGLRSDLVSLDRLSRKPGYYWVDFSFPKDDQSRLKPGKYWIVFRYSGEAIMNWFYIPGKPYSDSDDTRSTAKGFQWEDILNFDFVFKVAGKAI